jgi:hypothetical protein
MASRDPPPVKEVVEFPVNKVVPSVPDLLALASEGNHPAKCKHPGCESEHPKKDSIGVKMASRDPPPVKEVVESPVEIGPEYYGIKLVPARLLSINVAAHSFKMYFKLYIQVELKDKNVEKYIRTKQEKKEGIKPLSADEVKALDDCCCRCCPDCTNKEGKKCDEQKAKKKLLNALNVCFSDCLNGKATENNEEGGLTPKPEIVFDNRIGKVEVEKEVGSWKLVSRESGASYFIVYNLHQNCTGEFSLSLQDRCGLWRMRNYPFDYYECCIDLFASRHTRPQDRASGQTEKKKISFRSLDVWWAAQKTGEKRKKKDMNIELVSNEWSVWQQDACICEPHECTCSLRGVPMECLYDDEGDAHYQVSFGTTTAATALLFNVA